MRAADAVGLCLDVGLVFRRSAWRRSVFVAGPAREFAECRASSNYRGSLTVSLPIQSAEICPGAWSDCPPTKNERWRNGCGSRAGWAVLVTADGWEPGSDVDVRSVGAGCSLFRWIDAASGLQRVSVVEGLASQGLSPTQSGVSRCARCAGQGYRGRGYHDFPLASTTSWLEEEGA